MDDRLAMIEDTDMDLMFILPLSILPIKSQSIKTARLIKNSQLKSIVEIFKDEQTGSGQVDVETLPAVCGWRPGELHPDLVIIRQLALLPSYDVYSLRISLRQLQIPVNDFESLRLSEEKAAELSAYMIMFTRPLTKLIYGDDGADVKSYDDLIRMFRDPDIGRARERLINMAKTLSIDPTEVPRFPRKLRRYVHVSVVFPALPGAIGALFFGQPYGLGSHSQPFPAEAERQSDEDLRHHRGRHQFGDRQDHRHAGDF